MSGVVAGTAGDPRPPSPSELDERLSFSRPNLVTLALICPVCSPVCPCCSRSSGWESPHSPRKAFLRRPKLFLLPSPSSAAPRPHAALLPSAPAVVPSPDACPLLSSGLCCLQCHPLLTLFPSGSRRDPQNRRIWWMALRPQGLGLCGLWLPPPLPF